jgi:hypothetical protein
MRIFSANRFRASVLISEIAAAEKGSSRKAALAGAPLLGRIGRRRSWLVSATVASWEDRESTFSCRIVPPVV